MLRMGSAQLACIVCLAAALSIHAHTIRGTSTSSSIPTVFVPINESLTATSTFDGGNAEIVSIEGNTVTINVVFDPFSVYDNATWGMTYAVKISNVRGRQIKLVVANIASLSWYTSMAYYSQRYSYDAGKTWLNSPASLMNFTSAGANSTFSCEIPASTEGYNTVWIAYNGLYGVDRLQHYVGALQLAGTKQLVTVTQIGESWQGRPIELVQIGALTDNKVKIWVTGRIHPGELHSSNWIEGLLDRLVASNDTTAKTLMENAVLFVVPMTNPDGVHNGQQRTNAQGYNLNRVWDIANATEAPELHWIKIAMTKVGADLVLDVHMDSNQGCNFIFWPSYGVPGWDTQRDNITTKLMAQYSIATPDVYQVLPAEICGYPQDPFGMTPDGYTDSWTSLHLGAVGGTLEMPSSNIFLLPGQGAPNSKSWNPAQSYKFGADAVPAFLSVIPDLQKYRGYC